MPLRVARPWSRGEELEVAGLDGEGLEGEVLEVTGLDGEGLDGEDEEGCSEPP